MGWVVLLALAAECSVLHPALQGLRPGGHMTGTPPFVGLAKPPEMPGQFDIEVQYLPFLAHVQRELAAGRVALWNPFAGCGVPFLAAQQPAALHPFTWLALLVPWRHALLPISIMVLLTAFTGAWLLARSLGLGVIGCAASACSFALSGSIVTFMCYPLGNVFAHVPLLLALAVAFGRSPGRRSSAALALVLGSSVLAGFFEYLPIIWLVTAIAVIGSRGKLRLGLLVPFVGGAAISAVLLLPAIEYLQQSRSLAWRMLWQGGAPGSAWMVSAVVDPSLFARSTATEVARAGARPLLIAGSYLGSLALTLAFVGGTAREGRRLAFCLLLAAALWLPNPLSSVFWAIPPMRFMHAERLAGMLSLLLSLLAGIGMDRIAAGKARAWGAALAVGACVALMALEPRILPALRSLPSPARWISVAGGVLTLLGLLSALALKDRWPRSGRWIACGLLAAMLVERSRALSDLNRWEDPKRLFPVTDSLRALGARLGADRLVGEGGILYPITATAYGLRDIRSYDAIGVATYERSQSGDVSGPGLSLHERAPSPASREASARWVLLGSERTGETAGPPHVELPLPPVASGGSVAQTFVARRGYLRRISLAFETVHGQRPADVVVELRRSEEQGMLLWSTILKERWIPEAGPKEIAVDPAIWTDVGECLTLVVRQRAPAGDPHLTLLGVPPGQLPECLLDGRPIAASLWLSAEWGEPRLGALAAPMPKGLRMAEDPEAQPRATLELCHADRRAAARIEKDEPEEVDVRVTLPRADRLLLTDVLYPGWEASVDGHPTTIQAHGPFRAVVVPEGEHLVRYRYRPRSFRLGLFVTLLSILGLTSGVVVDPETRKPILWATSSKVRFPA